jgi:hypothetical protein
VFRLQQSQTAGPSDDECRCDLVSLPFTRLRPDPKPKEGDDTHAGKKRPLPRSRTMLPAMNPRPDFSDGLPGGGQPFGLVRMPSPAVINAVGHSDSTGTTS